MSSKSKIFDWLSNKIINEETKNYYDAFLRVGEEREIIPNSQIEGWYGGERVTDERVRIIETIEDVLIIDGLSLLYSPFTNYSTKEGDSFSLLDERESKLPNGSIRTTLSNLADRFLLLILRMMLQRPNLRLVAICFDKFSYHYLPKEETWTKRKENSAENSFCNAYSLDQPMKSDNFIVGRDTEGRYDYYTGIYDKKTRMNILHYITEQVSVKLQSIKREKNLRFCDIMIDTYGESVDSYEDVSKSQSLTGKSVVYFSYVKENLLYEVKPVSIDMYKRSYNIIEADTMIQKLIFYTIESCSKNDENKIVIEIIGNDADNLINSLLSYHLFRNFYGIKIDIFYRQIGGNSAHRFFGIQGVYNILLRHMTKYFRYKKNAGEKIRKQMDDRRVVNNFAMTDFLLFNVMSGTDYVNNIHSVGYATLIKKWLKILSRKPYAKIIKDRLPFVIDYNRRIVHCNEVESKLFILFLIGGITFEEYMSPTISIEKKIQNYAEKNLANFNDKLKKLTESLPVLLFIGDCENVFKDFETREVEDNGIEDIVKTVRPTTIVSDSLGDTLVEVAKRFAIDRDNSRVKSFGDIFERLKEYESFETEMEELKKKIEEVYEYYKLIVRYVMNIQPIWYSIVDEFGSAKKKITMNSLVESFSGRIDRNLVTPLKRNYPVTLERYKSIFFSNMKKIGTKLDVTLMEQNNFTNAINEFILKVWWNLIHIVCGGTWNFNVNNFYLNTQSFGFENYVDFVKLKNPISSQKQNYIQVDSTRIKPSLSVPNALDFYADASKINLPESDNLPSTDTWDPVVQRSTDFLKQYSSISIKTVTAFSIDFVRNYSNHWVRHSIIISLDRVDATLLPHPSIPLIEDIKLYTQETILKKNPSSISDLLADDGIVALSHLTIFKRSNIEKAKKIYQIKSNCEILTY